jgi:hypothetical protein
MLWDEAKRAATTFKQSKPSRGEDQDATRLVFMALPSSRIIFRVSKMCQKETTNIVDWILLQLDVTLRSEVLGEVKNLLFK